MFNGLNNQFFFKIKKVESKELTTPKFIHKWRRDTIMGD
jgi:hypothetical protein